MSEYLANHDGPVSLTQLYEFGLRHHVLPQAMTDKLRLVATDEDRLSMTDDEPMISPDTWRAIRDHVIELYPRVDYLWSATQSDVVANNIMQALLALGDDVDSIRSALHSVGAKGERMRACWCPVANYLRKRLGTDAVEVGHQRITVCGVSVQIPTPVERFITSFDVMQFPELCQVDDCRVLVTPARG